MTAYETLLVERTGGAAWVTLNRPEHRNATTEQMHEELVAAFADVRDDEEVHAVVLTGAGDDFCIGSDLGFLGSVLGGGGALGDHEAAQFTAYLDRLHRICFGLEDLPVPTIAMVNGRARASGFEIAVACDLVVIADEARIGDVHTPYGHMPGAGATQRTVRKIGLPRTLELLWTGRWLTAAEAVAYGLALWSAPRADLRARTEGLVTALAAVPRECLARIKHAVLAGADLPLAQGVGVERADYLELLTTSDLPAAAFVATQRALGRGPTSSG